MKRIRSAASSRHVAPAFVILSGLEQIQLRKLPFIARVLFLELVGLSNFATGRIATSYAVLAALLDFDVAPTANDPGKATHRRISTALDALAMLGLVKVDRIKNEKAKGLFFQVKSRAGISAPADKHVRQRVGHFDDANLAPARLVAVSPPEAGQTACKGVQEKRFNPLTPSLSTAPAPSIDVRELAAKTKRSIAEARAEAQAVSSDRAPRSRSTR